MIKRPGNLPSMRMCIRSANALYWINLLHQRALEEEDVSLLVCIFACLGSRCRAGPFLPKTHLMGSWALFTQNPESPQEPVTQEFCEGTIHTLQQLAQELRVLDLSSSGDFLVHTRG
ncbi:hypothetical protein BDZ94DRAFT_927384 [Collybia nuda]|uniref:Uncharacterized protein n=1 Tax=Collybia nuda TaxID=64659 RepID=A0A9P5Y135_9AGAR|nr:hypothetical protein BDZ94DRAFT_927384 [Collybia nuda]